MQLDPIAKIIIGVGVALIVVGIAWQLGWIQNLKLGHLPGDIRIEKENFKLYFPITTCLLISGIIFLIRWISTKL